MAVRDSTSSKESYLEQITRVRLMVEDDGATWDLSENDKAALKAVLDERDVLHATVETVASWCDHDLLEFGPGNSGTRQSRVNRIRGALRFAEGQS